MISEQKRFLDSKFISCLFMLIISKHRIEIRGSYNKISVN